ncbi:MAG: sensor histidine kinase [Cyclobacteriaceae bacterium]|nr:sensor histidine kinase [Cyclobacteriaceae bacterium]
MRRDQSILKKIVSLLFLGLVFHSNLVFSQHASASADYDVERMRLLLQASSLHLFTSNQGLIDIDSAVQLACAAQLRRATLVYDEGFNPDGKRLPGDSIVTPTQLAAAKRQLRTLKEKERVLLLLELGIHYLIRTGSAKDDMDSAYRYLSKAKSDAVEIDQRLAEEASIILARYYIKNNEPERGKNELLTVLSRRLQEKNPRAIAQIEEGLGTFLPYEDADKEMYLRRALHSYERLHDKIKQIDIWNRIVDVHFRQSKIDSVKIELLHTLDMQDSVGFKHTHYTHNVMSWVEFVMSNPYKGLFHATQAVKIMESTRDTTFAPFFYLRLGSAYQSLGHHEEALLWLERSITKNFRKNSRLLWYKSFFVVVQVLADLKRYEEGLKVVKEIIDEYPPDNEFDKMSVAYITGLCYEGLRQDDKAENSYREMVHWAEQLHDKQMVKDKAHAFALFSFFLADHSKHQEAKTYVAKARAMLTPGGLVGTRLQIYQAEFKIDSASGNHLAAIRDYKQFTALKDSLFNVNRTKQIEELKIQYETERQQKDLDLLSQKSEFQQSQLQNERLTKNITFGGSALLVILLVLLYHRYRVNQQKEKEIYKKNQALQKLVEEKEWLLKEIHHRVKNNLQVVVSLLSTQSSYLDNEPAQIAIRNSQHRMHAMSLIHQQLYQSDNVATIKMSGYIHELVNYLKESLHTGDKIDFEENVNDIELDVSQAVPVGLILNEAITNSIKYAFANREKGIICVTMKRQDSKFDVILKIRDNGSGFPAEFDIQEITSFGLSLIKGLTKQLGGQFHFSSDKGVVLVIEFTDENSAKTKGMLFKA